MEKDKGLYSIVITDPETAHKRVLDLSGDGQYLLLISQCHSFFSFFWVKQLNCGLTTTQPIVSMELLALVCTSRLSSDTPTKAVFFEYQTLLPVDCSARCVKLKLCSVTIHHGYN